MHMTRGTHKCRGTLQMGHWTLHLPIYWQSWDTISTYMQPWGPDLCDGTLFRHFLCRTAALFNIPNWLRHSLDHENLWWREAWSHPSSAVTLLIGEQIEFQMIQSTLIEWSLWNISGNVGLVSAGRINKDTPPLTTPSHTSKSSAMDISSHIF